MLNTCTLHAFALYEGLVGKRSPFPKDGGLNKRYGKFIFLLGLCFNCFDTLGQVNKICHILTVNYVI